MSETDFKYHYSNDVICELRVFMSHLEQLPKREDVLLNVLTNSEYIPIDVIEASFDRLVLGQYSFKNFKWQTSNEKEIGSIELEFYHPITGNLLTRTGAAAISIEQKQMQVSEGNVKVFSYELCHPALKSICKVSAIREIGVLFGRSLNREIVDMALSEKIAESTDFQQAINEVNSVSSYQELQDMKQDLIQKYATILNPQEISLLNKSITDKLVKLIT